MKLFSWAADGGKKSGVTGFWFIELKGLFSIVLLKFAEGSREAFHSHAFNAVTFFIWGRVIEHHVDGRAITWRPSFRPKYTPRSCFHKVYAEVDTYAVSFRGPWADTWKEYSPVTRRTTTLTHGRRVVVE